MKNKNGTRTERKAIRNAEVETQRRKTWGQSLQVESLEARQMMAGDVSVSFNGAGDLLVVGDGDDNGVDISTNILDGDLIVTGTGGTNIIFDGVSASSHEIFLDSNFTVAGDLKIIMRAGNDSVTVADLDVNDGVTAIMGGGDDTFNFSSGDVGAMAVRGGGGNDALTVGTTVDIGDDLVAVMGGGDDTVTLDGVSVGDDLVVASVEGAGALDAFDVEVVDQMIIRSGGGDDVITFDAGDAGTRVKVIAKGGDDDVTFSSSTVSGDFVSILGGGNDSLLVDTSNIGDRSRIVAGGGDDGLTMVDAFVDGDLTVVTGGGDDTVDVTTSSFDGSTLARTGGGDDTISFTGTLLSNNTFAADVQLHGGGGADEVNGVEPNFSIEADLISIETIDLVAPV